MAALWSHNLLLILARELGRVRKYSCKTSPSARVHRNSFSCLNHALNCYNDGCPNSLALFGYYRQPVYPLYTLHNLVITRNYLLLGTNKVCCCCCTRTIFYFLNRIQWNLPYTETRGTKHSCPLTGDVRLREFEKNKHHRGDSHAF